MARRSSECLRTEPRNRKGWDARPCNAASSSAGTDGAVDGGSALVRGGGGVPRVVAHGSVGHAELSWLPAGAAWLSVAQMRKRWAYEQEFAQYDDPL